MPEDKIISDNKEAARKELVAAIARTIAANEAYDNKIKEIRNNLPEYKAYLEAKTELKRLHEIYNNIK